MSQISEKSQVIRPGSDGTVKAINNYVGPRRVVRNVSTTSGDYAEISSLPPSASVSCLPSQHSPWTTTTTTQPHPSQQMGPAKQQRRTSLPSASHAVSKLNGWGQEDERTGGGGAEVERVDLSPLRSAQTPGEERKKEERRPGAREEATGASTKRGCCCSCWSWKVWCALLGVVELILLSYPLLSTIIIDTKSSQLSWYLQPILATVWTREGGRDWVLWPIVVVASLSILAVICLLQALDSNSPTLATPHILMQLLLIVALLALAAFGIYQLATDAHFSGGPSQKSRTRRVIRQAAADDYDYDYYKEAAAAELGSSIKSPATTKPTLPPPSQPPRPPPTAATTRRVTTTTPGDYYQAPPVYNYVDEVEEEEEEEVKKTTTTRKPTAKPKPRLRNQGRAGLGGFEGRGSRGQGILLIACVVICLFGALIAAALLPYIIRVRRRLGEARKAALETHPPPTS